jgi:hypothetical protein
MNITKMDSTILKESSTIPVLVFLCGAVSLIEKPATIIKIKDQNLGDDNGSII